MKCFSLFAGCGGFDLAAQSLGHTIVGACEIDRYSRSVYARHFPKVPLYQDATKLNPAELPDFDLLTAGFPCQPFSIAGQRRGFKEPRGNLFFEIARTLSYKRPQLFLLENVKGLLNHQAGNTFQTILQTLDELRYDIQWQIIDSRHYTPQSRTRIYIVGHARTRPRPEAFPLTVHTKHNPQTPGKPPEKRSRVRGPHCRAIDANYYKGGQGRSVLAVPITHPERAIHQNKNIRTITPLEAERLQGFPDLYTKYGHDHTIISDTQRYKMLGNAVTVPVVRHIMEQLK